MRLNPVIVPTLVLIACGTLFLLIKMKHHPAPAAEVYGEENEEQQARFVYERARYEFDMLKDPATGKIPKNIYEAEMAQARTIPTKSLGGIDQNSRVAALNTYLPAGPNNIGGRTRALAYDMRYNGTTNRVIIAGCVSGGIMRSTDGGANWTRVSPDNDIHNVTALKQDPRPGSQDIWYAGGGENLGNSADDVGALYLGFGVYKSVNNGVTWTKLPLNTITSISGTGILVPGAQEAFDHPFDLVHNIAVNPVNGDVYFASHRRLVRSSDGGNTFRVVFESATTALTINGQMEVACTNTGRFLLAVNGGSASFDKRGIWVSTTGDPDSWTRIAGGQTLGVDSVANWRANSYSIVQAGPPVQYDGKRIILAIAPSNQNIAYICYENGLSNESPDLKPEADLFKLNMTTGFSWTNLSDNMPNFGKNHPATDPLAIQGGYDMLISVKPTDPNFVILGGTSLYRSTDGFSSTANSSWIGGYHPSTTSASLFIYPNSHADMHNFVFNPSNPSEGLASNDGGIQLTSDINAAGNGNVVWSMVSNYQTMQYYYVAIDPELNKNNFIGGAQDNGTQFRDKTGLLGTAAADSNNHRRLISGDGSSVSFGKINGSSQFAYGGFQLGNIRRIQLNSTFPTADIRPNVLTPNPGTTSEYGEFVTNFRLDPDNTEDLYYVNYNRLFRTTSASSVTASGWTELTGVSTAIDANGATGGFNAIRAMGFSRGPYLTSHALFLGTTNGKVFRVDDPRNILATSSPVDITPPGNTGNVQDIAVNPNNDDEVMVAISNYGVTSVWWTNNAKSAVPTWRNGEGNLSLPSFRSCKIVVKKDAANNPVTEYYVGTSVGLYSVAELGTTLLASASPVWTREGGTMLNFAVAQTMAYRPGDNVLVLGTHGNGMYYTFIGTPNFTPNINTGINNPVINDKNFIQSVYPNITTSQVNYRIGNMFSIKRISVQLFNMSGQKMAQLESGYQSGTLDISRYSRGAYILSILSDDGKFRHLQKLIRQ